MPDLAAGSWPATIQLRALLDALLAEVPSGHVRLAIAQALDLASRHELVPAELAPTPSTIRPVPIPKEPHV